MPVNKTRDHQSLCGTNETGPRKSIQKPRIERLEALTGFAGILMFGSIVGKNLDWKGLDFSFGYFKYLMPSSYVIYISHQQLVVEATYQKFLNSKIIEYGLQFMFLILFSYFLEVVVYNKIRNLII